MILRNLSRLPAQCFYKDCLSQNEALSVRALSPKSRLLVRKGSYSRSSDSRRISRFQCLVCKRTFSQASYSDCFRQKKRTINEKLRQLLSENATIRGAARVLKISRHTVAEKKLFLAKKAVSWQESFLKEYTAQSPIHEVQFDEMEAFERSKCLPVSIPLVVESGTRLILGARVCSMPAKGLLAKISRKKYGYRPDERPHAAQDLFSGLKPFLSSTLEIRSDENPKYPSWIRPHFPEASHLKFKGRRGCVVGQGELKRGGFDPLFSLNHTAAMLRAHVSRLFRRTWNTTKKKERLAAHIAIYIQAHNQQILAKL
jgi:transposase-like protein